MINAQPVSSWQLAERAALVSAVDPSATGGVVVKAFAGPVRDEWLSRYRRLLGPERPIQRVPVTVSQDRLAAGLDLAATLREGRMVVQRGILADAHGGVVQLSMAERLPEHVVSTVVAALDTKRVVVHRDGVSLQYDASIGVIALDEGLAPDETIAFSLRDRLGFWVDLTQLGVHDVEEATVDPAVVTQARDKWQSVLCDKTRLATLCAVASSLGVDSLRAMLATERTAKIIAALAGRRQVNDDHLSEAIQLIVVPRATQIPEFEDQTESTPEHADDAESSPDQSEAHSDADRDPPMDENNEPQDLTGAELEDLVLQSALARLPAGLLARIEMLNRRDRGARAGRSGEITRSKMRGRPVGHEAGKPDSGKRLDLLASLRAAAPWQRLRRQEATLDEPTSRKVFVKPEDLRVKRFQQRAETTTIFVVDASGSAALHRLAEAKGAVETLLADCYSRRDQVALIAFRGASAELLLPPTRSLVRAKKAIIALPGGGGTPIAAALDSARILAEQVRREGATAAVVLLTDGKANICRDGSSGREAAMQDALRSADEFADIGFRGIVVDTSPRPSHHAQQIAERLGGHYLPLPVVDAKALSGVIQDVLH